MASTGSLPNGKWNLDALFGCLLDNIVGIYRDQIMERKAPSRRCRRVETNFGGVVSNRPQSFMRRHDAVSEPIRYPTNRREVEAVGDDSFEHLLPRSAMLTLI